jgi:hypothetical protein
MIKIKNIVKTIITFNLMLIVIGIPASSFPEVSEKDMDILYTNPPRAKKVKFSYILNKPSIQKINNNNHLYQFTLMQIASGGTVKWKIRTNCENKKLALGCGLMFDGNIDHIIKKTDSCSSNTFEPFEVPKDKDWKAVVKVFCERYDK